MLRPYLKIWDWDWISGRAVKAAPSLAVRSPCLKSFNFDLNICVWCRKRLMLKNLMPNLDYWLVVCKVFKKNDLSLMHTLEDIEILYVFLMSMTYSHHSIKRTGSIKRPGLEFFKKSLLNVPYDPKFLSPNSLSYCLY